MIRDVHAGKKVIRPSASVH